MDREFTVGSPEHRVYVRTRRQEVSLRMARGMTCVEIAADMGEREDTVRGDIQANRKNWAVEHNRTISEHQAQELNFYYEQREFSRRLWEDTEKVGYGRMVLDWSMRISNLLGLDMPKKVDTSTTDKQWREQLKEYAEKENISEQEALRQLIEETEKIVNGESDSGADASGGIEEEAGTEKVPVDADSRQGWQAESPTPGV